MVELGFLPFGFKMAFVAGRAEIALVNILFGMAAVAVLGRLVDVEFSSVTSVAFYFCMGIAQAKSRIAIMLELDLLP